MARRWSSRRTQQREPPGRSGLGSVLEFLRFRDACRPEACIDPVVSGKPPCVRLSVANLAERLRCMSGVFRRVGERCAIYRCPANVGMARSEKWIPQPAFAVSRLPVGDRRTGVQSVGRCVPTRRVNPMNLTLTISTGLRVPRSGPPDPTVADPLPGRWNSALSRLRQAFRNPLRFGQRPLRRARVPRMTAGTRLPWTSTTPFDPTYAPCGSGSALSAEGLRRY